jgi:hypothetical protein
MSADRRETEVGVRHDAGIDAPLHRTSKNQPRAGRGRKDETRLHDEQPMPYDADARRVGEAPSSCWHSGQTVPVPRAEADDARDAATRAALDVLRERARYWAERAVGPSRNCPK